VKAGHHAKGTYRRKMIDILRELVKRPRTVAQLLDLCDTNANSLYDLLDLLVEGGLAWKTGAGVGGDPFVFHWCPVPFERPESAKPDR